MAQPFYYEYTPESGDSLASVILRLYDEPPWSRRCEELRAVILQMNPRLKNSDRLERVALRVPDPYGSMLPPGLGSPLVSAPTASAEEHRKFWAMAWAEHSGLLNSPGSVALGSGANLLSGGNLDLLRQIGDEYAAYRSGHLTKGQYDYRRRLLIERFRANAGPFERMMFRGLDTQQAIRIARHGGVPYDHNISQNVARLRQLGTLASRGGIVLTGVGMTAACVQIANTEDQKKKNEVFVDTVTSSVTGIVIGLFVVSNPIGWGTALVLATSGAAASYLAGKVALRVYSSNFSEIDLVNGAGVDQVCR